MRWYKYMEKCFAEKMVTSGGIRLNSLNYYKDIETHGRGVGDKEENILNAVSENKGTKTIDQLNPVEQMFFKPAPGADPSTIKIIGGTFIWPSSGRPTYVFCLSDVFDADFLHQMNKENKKVGKNLYDTCVMISDHISFVNILKKQLKDYGLNYYGHGHCLYETRNIPWEEWDSKSQQCPAFVKDPSYSWQNEVRVLFEAKLQDDLEPIDCQIEGLSDLCSIIEVN